MGLWYEESKWIWTLIYPRLIINTLYLPLPPLYMETIATFIDSKNPKIRARIVDSIDDESPRKWDNTCKFHFKYDRNYKLPHEAEDIIDWQFFYGENESDEEEWKQEKKEYFEELNKNYHVFWMYYKNYSSAWSLFFKECDIEDEKMIGLALVTKGIDSLTWFNGTKYEDARKCFEGELKLYQQWNEWETFWVRIEQLQIWTNKETKETKEEWENIDSCYGFYGTTDEEYKQAIQEVNEFNF